MKILRRNKVNKYKIVLLFMTMGVSMEAKCDVRRKLKLTFVIFGTHYHNDTLY